MTPEQEALVLAHDELAQRYASAFLRRLPPHIERGDVVQSARYGLCQAALRWRPGTGVPFDAYARRRIRGAIIDNLRNNRGVATHSDVVDGKRRNRRHAAMMQLCALTGPVSRRGDPALPYDPAAPDTRELLDRAILLDQIDKRLDDIDPREAFTIRAHCAGRTLKAIGADLGVVESRASQLYSSGAKRLRRHLAA